MATHYKESIRQAYFPNKGNPIVNHRYRVFYFTRPLIITNRFLTSTSPQHAKMSLTSLPIEIIAHIFNLLDESKPKKSHQAVKHKEMCKTLAAIRLTCKELEEIARRPLFRTFCLSPSLESWKKLLSISASEKLRVHLQILAFEDYHDRSNSNCSRDWHNNTLRNPQGMKAAIKSPGLSFLDLSLLSNLKVLKAKDSWLITKKPRSNIEIPWGHCRIHAEFYCMASEQPIFWDLLTRLLEITRYDFEISSLNCRLGPAGPWQTLLNLDFSGLKYLRLYYQDNYWSNPHDLPVDLKILERLQNLPKLEEFRLDQSYDSIPPNARTLMVGNGRGMGVFIFPYRHYGTPLLTIQSTTNVLQNLRDKNWPRLRHLDLRSLNTTVADFQAFVKPHAGSLKSFQLRNKLCCADVTAEEELRRHELPHWIRTVVFPRGGGSRVKILGQAEGCWAGGGFSGAASKKIDADD